jgi:hypothetical protein
MMNYWESYGNIKKKKEVARRLYLVWNLSKGILSHTQYDPQGLNNFKVHD